MATLASKLSRAIMTKPSRIKQLVPLTSSGGNFAAPNGSQQQQHRMFGLSRYDRVEPGQGRRDETRNIMLLPAAFPLLLNSRQQVAKQQQRRFLCAGRQQTFQASGGGATTGSTSAHNYDTVKLTRPRKYVASVELNRPKTKNAFSLETADEFVNLFKQLDMDPAVRCVLLSGQGADFTSGVDIKSFMDVYAQLQDIEDVAHRARVLRTLVERFQAPFKAMYSFGKPIICVQHGLSLGLAMELAACSDVRYCTRDTRMSIREVLIGIAADVGSLQLMPRLVANQSLLSELIYTGRDITTDEALNELKFVSRVFDTKELAVESALELASTIASRSPVAIQGSKRNLRFSREQPFEIGLDYNAVWNAAMLQGGDVVKAISAILSKQKDGVEYDDL